MPASNKKSVQWLFRGWSRVYDHPVPQRIFYRRIHRDILKWWQPTAHQSVLDVGCGTGLFLDALRRDHPALKLSGLDLSAEMLKQASWSGAEGPGRVQASVYALPFVEDSFDVLLNTISCHFYLKQVEAFSEMARVLRPGGTLYCASLVAPFTNNASGMAVAHPPRTMRRHLGQAGLTVKRDRWIFPNVWLFEAGR